MRPNENWALPEELTREQRIKAYYLSMAGTLPGPNLAFVAVLIAHRLVELEDKQE